MLPLKPSTNERPPTKNQQPTAISPKSILSTALFPIASLAQATLHQSALAPIEKAAHPLKMLILGGTSFLGPHQIAYALQRGHSITPFTRGKTQATVHQKLFKKVE